MQSGSNDYAQELNQLLTSSTAGQAHPTETKWMQKQFIFNEVKNNTTLQINSNLNTFYTGNQNNTYGKLRDVDDKVINEQYAAAKWVNNTVNATGTIEQNQKTFNAIYLNHLVGNVPYSASNIYDLYDIANQCSNVGGNAVVQSRNLLMFIENRIIDFTNNCDELSSDPKNLEHLISLPINEERNINLYPNPNNGNITVECSLKENETGTLSIYDLTGKLITSYQLNTANTLNTINAEKLQAGIYLYNIMINNKKVKTDKLVIIK